MNGWNPALLVAPMSRAVEGQALGWHELGWHEGGSDEGDGSYPQPRRGNEVVGRGPALADRSFERLQRPNEMHLPLGPDPVAAAVIFTLCLLVLMLGAIFFVIVGSIAG